MTDHEVKLDFERHRRNGQQEAIYCAHKSNEQIAVILEQVYAKGRSCLLTRLSPDQYSAIPGSLKQDIDYDEISATGYFNWYSETFDDPQLVVLTAGSADLPVARETLRTLRYFRVNALPIFDVGVAGLWRLLDRIDDIREFPIAIVAAGMDASLPTVLGGLFEGLIIAVPTSQGYGVAEGGSAALNSILASCSAGIVTVNIDNGYGAACAALRVLPNQIRRDAGFSNRRMQHEI